LSQELPHTILMEVDQIQRGYERSVGLDNVRKLLICLLQSPIINIWITVGISWKSWGSCYYRKWLNQTNFVIFRRE